MDSTTETMERIYGLLARHVPRLVHSSNACLFERRKREHYPEFMREAIRHRYAVESESVSDLARCLEIPAGSVRRILIASGIYRPKFTRRRRTAA